MQLRYGQSSTMHKRLGCFGTERVVCFPKTLVPDPTEVE